MNKKIWAIVLAVIVLGAGAYLFFEKQSRPIAPSAASFDPLNATYAIENEPIALVNGKAQGPSAPGSAEQTVTSVFGQPVMGDLNNDGNSDAAMIVTQDPGGSGTFYYVVAAIDTTSGAVGTQAILLGDRIAPQNITIQNGRIIVNYADRGPGEPMSSAPSVGITKYFSVNSSTLQEVSSTQPER